MPRFIGFLRKLWRLNRNASLDRDQIEELREEKFRELLHHAWDRTEFYPSYYREHGIERDDLDSIPFEEIPSIDKETYTENFDRMATDDRLRHDAVEEFAESNPDTGDRFLDEYVPLHTSGTTGDPTYFVYHEDEWGTVLAGAARAMQGDFGARRLIESVVPGYRIAYVAATRGRFGGVVAVESSADYFGSDLLRIDVNQPLDDWHDELAEFDPNVLVGYPSAVKLVCDIVNEADLELDLFRVVTGGEPLSPDLRDYIETTLGEEVFNLYGAAESLVIGLERGEYDGMYIYDDLNYVEPAQKSTYITPLYRRAVPLIRYELDDKLDLADRADDEPLPFTKVRTVVGRSDELIWFETDDGEEFLHPLAIEEIYAEGLVRHQFVQHSERRFEVRVETEDDADFDRVREGVIEQVDAFLDEKGLEDLDYTVSHADEISVDPETGKRKMVVKGLED